MEYITALICTAIAFCAAVLSCVAANTRLSESYRTADNVNIITGFEKMRTGLSKITIKQWIVSAAFTLLTGFACYRAQVFGADQIQAIKAVVCCELVMSAAIIDLFTRKIPNRLNLALYIAGILLLAAELIFNRESFTTRLIASLIGLGVGFGFLYIMSLVTKGGMGMGDVKLIGGVGLSFGIAAVFYSFTYSMVVCLLAAVVMLISGRKKMKDKVPFCPFFYLGLIISVSIGTF